MTAIERELKSCFFCQEKQHDSDSEDDFAEDVLVNPAGRRKGRRIDACTDCLIWCPEAYVGKDKVWYNLDQTLKRCKRLKCRVCGKPNAPLGCKRMGCNKTFHQPCAISADCVFDEETFTISCLVCHEVMEARERKKKRLKEERIRRKKEKAMLKKRKRKAAEDRKKRKESNATRKKTTKRKALADLNGKKGKNNTRQTKKKSAKKSATKRMRKEEMPAKEEEEEETYDSEEEDEDIMAEARIAEAIRQNPVVLRLRPVVADLFKKLRKDDLPVQVVHDALTEFENATGKTPTSRQELDDALRILEDENRLMYRQYDNRWTVFLI